MVSIYNGIDLQVLQEPLYNWEANNLTQLDQMLLNIQLRIKEF